MKEWKKDIENLIISLPEDYYASDSDLAYLTKYDVCLGKDKGIDLHISMTDSFITKLWNNIVMHFEYYNDEEVEISLLTTNVGARVLEKAPKNTLITSYNTDYTCKVITDLVCQDKAEDGNYFSYMRDISQYFAVKNTNSSKKFDIVISQSGSEFYKGIDYSEEANNLSSCEYYTKRGYHFVEENGLLVVICRREDLKNTSEFISSQTETMIIKDIVESGVWCGIIIEKTDKYEDVEPPYNVTHNRIAKEIADIRERKIQK